MLRGCSVGNTPGCSVGDIPARDPGGWAARLETENPKALDGKAELRDWPLEPGARNVEQYVQAHIDEEGGQAMDGEPAIRLTGFSHGAG